MKQIAAIAFSLLAAACAQQPVAHPDKEVIIETPVEPGYRSQQQRVVINPGQGRIITK